MKFDFLNYRYPSQRTVVFGHRGMVAFMQPQGHVQVVMNMIDFGLNPQEALDSYRWQWVEDKKVFMILPRTLMTSVMR